MYISDVFDDSTTLSNIVEMVVGFHIKYLDILILRADK